MTQQETSNGSSPISSRRGLTSVEARTRLLQYGANTVHEETSQPFKEFIRKFWAPVPWMLELTIALQLALGKWNEAIVIAALLVVNSALSFAQEQRADKALALLKSRLSVKTRVLRDGRWQVISAPELVPGDVVHLRMGDLVPADMQLEEGDVLVDQSALTGESMPVEASAGSTVHAGAIVKHGGATGEVTATGTRTYFGKTAELVRTAKAVGHTQRFIFTIIRHLVVLDLVLVVVLVVYAFFTGMPMHEVAPFVLVLLVASAPVALPATFTLATALGAQELARQGVLVARLSAMEAAAAMDVLACDKTGTLTENKLSVAELVTQPGYTEKDLLQLAAMACDEATQDPIDLAILEAARQKGAIFEAWPRLRFIPFDTQTKRSEAIHATDRGELHVVKGLPRVITSLIANAPDIQTDLERLALRGYRILAVASGISEDRKLAGLVALEDPPRADSAAVVQRLRDLGIRTVMVTGDGLRTGLNVATAVGIGDRACSREILDGEQPSIEHCDVLARVFPEDKFRVVVGLQGAGHVVGMTGDGVNDAPALKQAEVGIAMANAVDVAKAAASLVLLNPGLNDAIAAVQESRRIHQRMLTYTLNKIIKTIQIAVFLSLGVMVAGELIITPALMVLLLFTNDLVTMSLATDRVQASPHPERWNVRALMLSAGILAVPILLLSFGVFFVARYRMHLPTPQLQTLMFLLLVFTGQSTVYLVRERYHFWHSRPSHWLLWASLLDIIVVTIFASLGILMAPIASSLIGALLAIVAIFMLVVDFFKFKWLAWVERYQQRHSKTR